MVKGNSSKMDYLIHYFMIVKLIFSTAQEDNNACCYEWKRVYKNLQAKEEYFQEYVSIVKWPNSTIYYDVDPHMDPRIRHYVAEAIDFFNKNQLTCVRWRQHLPFRSETQKTWVSFVQTRDSILYPSMSADVGPSNNTVIRLGYNAAKINLLFEKTIPDERIGLEYKTSVIHEMMHVLGFRHEHQRGDRDCWVYVDEDLKNAPGYKILKEWRYFFSPKFPYDLNSILHYPSSGKEFYAHDGSTLWRSDGKLSALDYIKLNYVYCDKPAYCDVNTQCAKDLVENRYNPRCFREGPAYNNTPTTCTPCHRRKKDT